MDYLHFLCSPKMVVVAQLVRALDCGSRGRRFDPGFPPRHLKAGTLCVPALYLLLIESTRNNAFNNNGIICT
jgi:hypothetical protein